MGAARGGVSKPVFSFFTMSAIDPTEGASIGKPA
ncbi:unannotated protein [freshwater metagenome]|uniref:Unannotated protein n=1 Tax=freshwater metagenome TaxID=449393 RepID=A0A6J5ZPH8_9ZZZZ